MTKCKFYRKPLDEKNNHYMNETTMCQNCLEGKTVLCQHCGKGGLFIGVELEIDDGGECSDNADTLMYIANRDNEHLYCKHDGSLEDGFEHVSHPMTLACHTEHMYWNYVQNIKLRKPCIKATNNR